MHALLSSQNSSPIILFSHNTKNILKQPHVLVILSDYFESSHFILHNSKSILKQPHVNEQPAVKQSHVNQQTVTQLMICSTLDFHINFFRLIIDHVDVHDALINDYNRKYI